MQAMLANLLNWAFTVGAGRILGSLGLGLASYAAIESALDNYLANMIAGFGALGDGLALLNLAGADQALSAICGAMVTSLAIQASKTFLTRS